MKRTKPAFFPKTPYEGSLLQSLGILPISSVSSVAGSLDGNFLWGLSGATDLSPYDPLLGLAVATARGDNTMRAEAGFSRHLNFRLFQQYRKDSGRSWGRQARLGVRPERKFLFAAVGLDARTFLATAPLVDCRKKLAAVPARQLKSMAVLADAVRRFTPPASPTCAVRRMRTAAPACAS